MGKCYISFFSLSSKYFAPKPGGFQHPQFKQTWWPHFTWRPLGLRRLCVTKPLWLTSFKPGLFVIYPFIHKSRTSAAIHHQYTAEDMQSCVTYTQAWSIVNQLRLVQIKPTAQKDQIKSVQNAKDYKRWHRPRGLISGVQTGIERQLEVRLADTCISPT